MVSLGGGPGYDFVGTALVAFYTNAGSDRICVHGTILDYEEGWSVLVRSMNTATQLALKQADFGVQWGGRCDISKSLYHPDNAPCLERVDTSHLWTCQYCVSENAKALRDSDNVFFRELFQAVPDGTLFLLTETTPRFWPDFYDLIQDGHVKQIEIAFPRSTGRGKKGNQLASVKTENPSAPTTLERHAKLVDEFRCR